MHAVRGLGRVHFVASAGASRGSRGPVCVRCRCVCRTVARPPAGFGWVGLGVGSGGVSRVRAVRARGGPLDQRPPCYFYLQRPEREERDRSLTKDR